MNIHFRTSALALTAAALIVGFSNCAQAMHHRKADSSSTTAGKSNDCQAWNGIYEYDETAGRTKDGTANIVNHTLKILSKHDRVVASLSSQGYDSSEALRCDTKCSGNQVAIQFKSYADGSLKNQKGVAPYKPGDTLLTLIKTSDNHKLLTNWQAFKLHDAKAANGKVYFHKAWDTR